MAVKKALALIDFLIAYETKMYTAMKDPNKSWNIGTSNIKDLTKVLSECHADNLQVLNTIKKELITNCKHPKKMRDKSPDGKWYCMNCNFDL